MRINDDDRGLLARYRADWNAFVREILGVRLDRQQRRIIRALQESRRVSVRSGHARGKDFTAAVASLCFLYLHYPSKVINTGPTQRQVTSIMMTEIGRLHKNALVPLGGRVTATRIKFDGEPNWFLEGFKAGDKAVESWTGYHSPHILVVVTEASGLADESFEAIEGLLTGDSRLLLIFNPVRTAGEAFKSTTSPLYSKFTLSGLNAVNVRSGRVLVPGQVDRTWVEERISSWCRPVDEGERDERMLDFSYRGAWYRPNDLFRVKVLGEFPREAEGQLIPLAWITAAQERWRLMSEAERTSGYLRLGVDVAGMGRDATCFARRYGQVIAGIELFSKLDGMAVCGRVMDALRVAEDSAYIDTIGEGAGVFARLKELGANAISVKGSESAEGLSDVTGERRFVNMRAWLHWAMRDALDPSGERPLALPPDDALMQEITAPQYEIRSDGKIIIEPKERIIARLGRSPDRLDAVLNTLYPHDNHAWQGTIWISEGR